MTASPMTVDLEAKLAQIADAAVVRPNADPHVAAVTALLVADWLAQRGVRDELAAAGIAREAVEELRALSRVILTAMGRLGGEYLPDAKSVPGEVLERGYAIRTQMLAKLDEGMHDDAGVAAWLAALKLGSGVVDLVFDLRTLADLHRDHEAPLAKRGLTSPSLVSAARSTADHVEYALREGETPDVAKNRNAIARAWTLFAPGYERAAAAGRAITDAASKSAASTFPPLGLVAAYRRGRRRAVPLVPIAQPTPHAFVPEVVRLTRSAPPPPSAKTGLLGAPFTTPGPRRSAPEARVQPRYRVELEVGLVSDSNLWAGFTENLSATGAFVATYVLRPIGARIEVKLTLPDGEFLDLEGTVRWQRAASPDGWPGMGVQFDPLEPAEDALIRKFLSAREPLLYDV